jgi:predicted nucleotidyltransferase
MNDAVLIDSVRGYFADDDMVKFAYLFGSIASGKAGPLSDLDMAIYLDRRLDSFKYRLQLMERLARLLKSEKFDLVVLNSAPVVLKYEVVKNGVILKDDRPRRVMFETAVLQEYLDTAYLRKVQREYIQQQLREESYFG